MEMSYEDYVNYVHQLQEQFSIAYRLKGKDTIYRFKFFDGPSKKATKASNLIFAYYAPAMGKSRMLNEYPGLRVCRMAFDGRGKKENLLSTIGHTSLTSIVDRERFQNAVADFHIYLILQDDSKPEEISFEEFTLLLWQPVISSYTTFDVATASSTQNLQKYLEQLRSLSPSGRKYLEEEGFQNIKNLLKNYEKSTQAKISEFRKISALVESKLTIAYSIDYQSYTFTRKNNPDIENNDIIAIIFWVYRPQLTPKDLQAGYALKIHPSKRFKDHLGLDVLSNGDFYQNAKKSNDKIRPIFSQQVRSSFKIIYTYNDKSRQVIQFETLHEMLKMLCDVPHIDSNLLIVDKIVKILQTSNKDFLLQLKCDQYGSSTENNVQKAKILDFPSLIWRKAQNEIAESKIDHSSHVSSQMASVSETDMGSANNSIPRNSNDQMTHFHTPGYFL